MPDFTPPEPEGTDPAEVHADDALLNDLGGIRVEDVTLEPLIKALRGWRDDVDAVPIPDSCADCGALAHRPHREDCPTLLHEPLPDTPGTPPDEVRHERANPHTQHTGEPHE